MMIIVIVLMAAMSQEHQLVLEDFIIVQMQVMMSEFPQPYCYCVN